MDIVYLAIVVTFWLAMVAMARGCARLEPRSRSAGAADSPPAAPPLGLHAGVAAVEGRSS